MDEYLAVALLCLVSLDSVLQVGVCNEFFSLGITASEFACKLLIHLGYHALSHTKLTEAEIMTELSFHLWLHPTLYHRVHKFDRPQHRIIRLLPHFVLLCD